uniref:H/ACA ribonucleoprotein complex subunit 2 n=1 Tax=Musa acuminata subsp. malaccensis TaxID=214687 RepID=A0A804KLM0_MUSAM
MGSDSENKKSVERKKPMAVAPIAKPLAGKNLCKRTLKLVRRAAEAKSLKRGLKEVVKSVRRGHKGLCVIAGNISPIDVITHVPILLEEADIPYIYVPSKEDLAVAGVTKRPTCCVLVLTKPTKGELVQEVQEKLQADYNQVVADVKELTTSLF